MAMTEFESYMGELLPSWHSTELEEFKAKYKISKTVSHFEGGQQYNKSAVNTYAAKVSMNVSLNR